MERTPLLRVAKIGELKVIEHDWYKQNLVTVDDRSGMYDLYVCRKCGKKYKRRGFDWNPPTTKCKDKRRA